MGMSSRREFVAMLLGAPIAAAPLAILVVRPRGGDLAMARYLVVALAPMLLASSFALFEFVRLARARVGVAYLAGLAFALLQLARGPLEPSWFRGTLANAPELVLPIGARVAAPMHAPELYARLAAAPHTLTVVEYPTPAFALPMLRSYESFHGQHVLVGLDASAREWCGSAPYISIWDRDALAARADWLILHVDPAAEVQDWLARAHAPRAPPAAEDLGAVRGALCARLGAPDYDDGRVVAWRFARS